MGESTGRLAIYPTQAQRVDVGERVTRGIYVKRIAAAQQSNGIAFDVPSSGRIEIPKAVLMQPGLSVEDLPGEP
jgi:hypothetical protein